MINTSSRLRSSASLTSVCRAMSPSGAAWCKRGHWMLSDVSSSRNLRARDLRSARAPARQGSRRRRGSNIRRADLPRRNKGKGRKRLRLFWHFRVRSCLSRCSRGFNTSSKTVVRGSITYNSVCYFSLFYLYEAESVIRMK
jgi:hypothetical protein